MCGYGCFHIVDPIRQLEGGNDPRQLFITIKIYQDG